MTLAYIAKLGFFIWKTDISIQKIDSLVIKTYEIIKAGFLV